MTNCALLESHARAAAQGGFPKQHFALLTYSLHMLTGLFADADAKTTFLAVPDGLLGTGDTVFQQAHLRFLQHTIVDDVLKV